VFAIFFIGGGGGVRNWAWFLRIKAVFTKAYFSLSFVSYFYLQTKMSKTSNQKHVIWPKLEYACAAWDPYLQKDINSLERVQRKAARFCTNGYQPTASVTDMIRELGWQTLEQRR